MPKSQSMPLRQALPDPFPEISHNPLSPASSVTTVNSTVSTEGSKSSPSSPVIQRVYSPDSPKKRAIDRSSGRHITRSNTVDVSKHYLSLYHLKIIIWLFAQCGDSIKSFISHYDLWGWICSASWHTLISRQEIWHKLIDILRARLAWHVAYMSPMGSANITRYKHMYYIIVTIQ